MQENVELSFPARPAQPSETSSAKISSLPLWSGLGLSFVYLIALALLTWSSWDKLWALTPNEFGDLMAGTFSPLAFLWLVVGFFQQGQELRASVKALELQGQELQNSVQQQEKMANAAWEDIALQKEVVAAANEVERRRAKPILRVEHIETGGLSNSGVVRSYGFRVSNSGPDITDFVCVDENGSKLISLPLFAKGTSQVARFGFPITGTVSVSFAMTYLNSLGERGSEEWVALRKDDEWDVRRFEG